MTSAFIFASMKVQSLFLINAIFQASSLLLKLKLNMPVYVGPGRKHRRPVFSSSRLNQRSSYTFAIKVDVERYEKTEPSLIKAFKYDI